MNKQACFLLHWDHIPKSTLKNSETEAQRGWVPSIKLHNDMTGKHRLKAKAPVHCCLPGSTHWMNEWVMKVLYWGCIIKLLGRQRKKSYLVWQFSRSHGLSLTELHGYHQDISCWPEEPGTLSLKYSSLTSVFLLQLFSNSLYSNEFVHFVSIVFLFLQICSQAKENQNQKHNLLRQPRKAPGEMVAVIRGANKPAEYK